MSKQGLDILNKKFQGAGNKQLDDADSFVWVHHLLMKEYGWMQADEFRDILMPTLWNLLQLIQKDREQEKKEYEKQKRK